MTSLRIDELRLEMSGVDAEVARSAFTGLDAELRRRLGDRAIGLHGDPRATLRLPPLDAPQGIDATRLRALIADRLVELLTEGA